MQSKNIRMGKGLRKWNKNNFQGPWFWTRGAVASEQGVCRFISKMAWSVPNLPGLYTRTNIENLLCARCYTYFPSHFESEQQRMNKVGWPLPGLPFLPPSLCLYLFLPIQAKGSFFPQPLNTLSREPRPQSLTPQCVLKSHLRCFHYEPY